MIEATTIVGRSPETLTIQERRELAGQWMAVEVYSPDTLPLRLIEAIGNSPAACAEQLRQRGLDPTRFEYTVVKPAF